MTRKCHVPFCRAVGRATSSLTLIIRDEGLRISKSLTSGTGDKAYRQTVRRSNRGRKKSTTTLVSG